MRRIKLMADYQCSPLWEASPSIVGDIHLDDLPISDDLRQGLRDWAREYDLTLDLDDPESSGFSNAEAEAEFNRKGYELADRLRKELGDGFELIVQI